MSDEFVSLMIDTHQNFARYGSYTVFNGEEFVVTQVVSSGFVSLPLHRIHLKRLTAMTYCCWWHFHSAYETRIYVDKEQIRWWLGNYSLESSSRTSHLA